MEAQSLQAYSSRKSAKKAVDRQIGRIKELDVISTRYYEDDNKWYAEITLNCFEGDLAEDELELLKSFALVYEKVKEQSPEPVIVKSRPVIAKPVKSEVANVNKINKKESINCINAIPAKKAWPARAGTKQAKVIDALWQGCSLSQLKKICTTDEGKQWSDGSIRSMLYWDTARKGYGIRTDLSGAEPVYHLILPEGLVSPLPHQPKKKK